MTDFIYLKISIGQLLVWFYASEKLASACPSQKKKKMLRSDEMVSIKCLVNCGVLYSPAEWMWALSSSVA